MEHRVVPLGRLGCLQLVRWKVSFAVVEKCSKVDRHCYLPLRTNNSTGGHQRSRNVSVVTVFKLISIVRWVQSPAKEA